jgi:hypothetical protein
MCLKGKKVCNFLIVNGKMFLQRMLNIEKQSDIIYMGTGIDSILKNQHSIEKGMMLHNQMWKMEDASASNLENMLSIVSMLLSMFDTSMRTVNKCYLMNFHRCLLGNILHNYEELN